MNINWPMASLLGCFACTIGTVAVFAILAWAARHSRKD